MTISICDKWIWDSWYARDGDTWHAYFLQADKSIGDPDLRHWNVTQGHATSSDLISWEHLGTTFSPSKTPAWDDYTTWTGCVIKDDSNTWHLFYTGTSRAEDGMYQRIGHATSNDMHNWARVGDGLCLDLTGENANNYEATHAIGHWHDRAMRDPWVIRDPHGDGWLMYFTARAPDIQEPNAGGVIGFATSSDLINWKLQPPVFIGAYGQLEVPQVFVYSDTWYCLFCTAAEHWSLETIKRAKETPITGSHYLIGDGPRGPWHLPDGPFFDGALPCQRYAARIVENESGLQLLAFVDTGKDTFKGFVSDPVPVEQLDNGLLSIPTKEV